MTNTLKRKGSSGVSVKSGMTIHLQSTTLHPEKYLTNEYYPFNLPLFQKTARVLFQRPVTLFAGANGSGKSTLLEAIARICGIFSFDQTPIKQIAHEDTEHYQIYKSFMEDRGRYL